MPWTFSMNRMVADADARDIGIMIPIAIANSSINRVMFIFGWKSGFYWCCFHQSTADPPRVLRLVTSRIRTQSTKKQVNCGDSARGGCSGESSDVRGVEACAVL